ncbi:hypothetical protein JR316_0000784 [Psilocybe cubensis]|uniref:Histone deacetylase complex subunit SAP30 Sin3 binding domain-containing protein n=2 Tax=Psilocybe cubensis TaxID=181762 RepID=A0A8H7YA52_PSICU|nr:hypothetical protein JR316_0000784 [Psilocybe cubensis]KAH9486719.1 hypothetical protein JR316_0000784 [Psilocybe cubensis]
MSSSAQTLSASRSRNQARKKVNDDASYFGPPVTAPGPSALKRQAIEKADGEPRLKRKKVEPNVLAMGVGKKDVAEVDTRRSLVEFQKMSTPMLHRYMIQFDIVPGVYPSPLTAEDPPAPSSLADLEQQLSQAASPPALTPANRPRRDPKDAQTRRRSSRLLEEEPRHRVPVLADVQELHGVLATIVERHFREMNSISGREEVDTLAAFMCAVEKTKSAKLIGNGL